MHKKIYKSILCAVMAAVMTVSMVSCNAPEVPEEKPEEVIEIAPEVEEPSETEEEEVAEELEEVYSDDEIRSMIENMTTEQKIAQMITIDIRKFGPDADNLEGVKVLPDELKTMLGKYDFGGVILFADNVSGTEQCVKLIADIDEASAGEGAKGHIAPIISIDQEGGYITRLPMGTSMPGNMLLGATGNKELAFENGALIARELNALGIDVDFAPVCDVNNNPANPVIGVRSFGDDPATVSEMSARMVEGFESEGIITSLKHFPGHGNTDTDSHTGLPVINSTLDELRNYELEAFKGALAESGMVMTAHIIYPNVSTEKYTSLADGEEITLPATLSKTILTDVLRNEMGYEGVIVTDAFDMEAITSHIDRYDAASLAIDAGVDMILMPVKTTTPEGIADMDVYMEKLVSMVDDGTISMDRVDESVFRILRLKADYGKLDYVQTSAEGVEGLVTNAKKIVGSEGNHYTEYQIAKEGTTLIYNGENDDVLPLNAKEDRGLIIYSTKKAEFNLAVDNAFARLREEGLAEPASLVGFVDIEQNSVDSIKAMMTNVDFVILLNECNNLDMLNPTLETSEYAKTMHEIADAVKENQKLIIVSTHLPYDIGSFDKADAIVCAYGKKCLTGSMDNEMEEGDNRAYGVNTEAAICGIFGEYEFNGTLPVNVYKLDSDYKLTDEILYERGYGIRQYE